MKKVTLLIGFVLFCNIIITNNSYSSINSGLITGERGIKLIKSFEGVRLTSYRCPAGVLTVGYGHTGDVKQGLHITTQDAETLLKKDLKRFEKHVSNSVYLVELNQNQFDALISLTFNCGYVIKIGLKTDLNAADYESATNRILSYCHVKGKVLNGLLRRRKAEVNLFNNNEL